VYFVFGGIEERLVRSLLSVLLVAAAVIAIAAYFNIKLFLLTVQIKDYLFHRKYGIKLLFNC